LIKGGLASEYFRSSEVGSKTQLMGPLGRFSYKNTTLKKVFICTGTGIAPFITMLKELKGRNTPIDIFFGAKSKKENYGINYVKNYLNENIKYYSCLSREPNELGVQGRVTVIVPQQNYDWKNTEFYLC